MNRRPSNAESGRAAERARLPQDDLGRGPAADRHKRGPKALQCAAVARIFDGQTTVFTASEIAEALGVRPQSIRESLNCAMTTGTKLVGGNLAQAWSVSALPVQLQARLEGIAQRKGCRSVEHLLGLPAEGWAPALPLAEIDPECVQGAIKLQRALAPSLARESDTTISEAEFERLGVADYALVFGHAITARHWRSLFRRTKERDGNRELWSRLEIYLPEKPRRKQTGPATVRGADLPFADLLDAISDFMNPAAPTPLEERFLWRRSFEMYEERQEFGDIPARDWRAGLVKFLWRHAPFLAATPAALRRNWDRKLAHWTRNDRKASALIDQRSQKSGWRRAAPFAGDDRDALIAEATFKTGGNVSQAWRNLRDGRELSEELLSSHIVNPADKSYVPKRVRKSVRHEVRMLEDIHHGPRRAKLRGAHIDRDWSGVHAMDWFCADDVTLDVYYHVPDGNGWFTLMRGQCLLMIDVRSTRILGYALLHSRNYNSLAIRTLITKTCDEHGLPNRGFYFENGIWRSSKLLKGAGRQFSTSEAEQGLREFGLQFVHSRLPRSKPVERVIGAIQRSLKGEPGYCGNDEIHDGFERLQRAQLDVKARRVHPSKHFYDEAAWCARLDEICARYNGEPQNGKMLPGISPDDGFEQLRETGNPPVRFDARCRYLLAHHRAPVRVTGNGITLRIGKQSYNYRDEQTGRHVGAMMLAWFVPDAPEILTVTDLERQNPFCVARSQSVPAMDATAEEVGGELARIEAHQSFGKARYRTLRTRFTPRFRPNLVSADVAEVGEQMGEQRAALESRQREQQQLDARARRLSGELHYNLPAAARRDPESLDAAAELRDLLAQAKKEDKP